MRDCQDAHRVSIGAINERVGKTDHYLTSNGTAKWTTEERFARQTLQSLLNCIKKSNAEFRSALLIVRRRVAQFVRCFPDKLRSAEAHGPTDTSELATA